MVGIGACALLARKVAKLCTVAGCLEYLAQRRMHAAAGEGSKALNNYYEIDLQTKYVIRVRVQFYLRELNLI